MTPEQQAALLSKSIPEITKQVDELSLAEVCALLVAESAGEKRKGVFDVIQGELTIRDVKFKSMQTDADETLKTIESLQSDVTALDEEVSNLTSQLNSAEELLEEDAGGKDERGEDIPDFKKLDYNGPITGEIAAWRNANIITKGVGKDERLEYVEPDPEPEAESTEDE